MRKYHSPETIKKAQRLRATGVGYKDIGLHFGIAKSTARLWTQDISLSETAKNRLYTQAILKMTTGSNNARARRDKQIEKILQGAQADVSLPISRNVFMLLGAMIYWGEGSKTTHFSVINSDPLLIQFIVKWFCEIFNQPRRNLTATLNIYSQQDENEIKKFWSALTGIPLENFKKSFVKPVNKYYKKNNLYYGTIKIRVKNGSDMRERTFGWIRTILDNLSIKTENIETRWNHLKTPRTS